MATYRHPLRQARSQFPCRYHARRCPPTRPTSPIAEATPSTAADQFRGGTQAIVFHGGWLALIHEVSEREKRRYYQHRFVWFDSSSRLRRVSRPFFFIRKGVVFFIRKRVEFAAGLARLPEKGLLISFGVGDGEAWIATVEASEVRRLLDDAERSPSERPRAQPARQKQKRPAAISRT